MDYAVNNGLVRGYTFYKIKYFWIKKTIVELTKLLAESTLT